MATTYGLGLQGDLDQRVYLRDVSWSDYEAILAIRGDRSAPRITYLRGNLELMSPSYEHEWIKSAIGRLVEAYAEHAGTSIAAVGSWTLRNAPQERGAEPDECYVLGPGRPEAPDIAIEVVLTGGGLDKLEVYRGLGVREVWRWRQGTIEVHALRGERYERTTRSELLPGLDLDKVAELCTMSDQTGAVRAFRAWLIGQSG